MHLRHIDALDQARAAIEREVGLGLESLRQAATLPSKMAGSSAVSAHVVVAEVGIDMPRFATPGELLSCAGRCPAKDESTSKRRGTRLRRDGKWLETTPAQAAWSAVKVKFKRSDSQAQFHRPPARRGAKKVIIATAASLLTAARARWEVFHFRSAVIARAASVWRARYASSFARSTGFSFASIATANKAAFAAPATPIAKVATGIPFGI